jgi:hypothetical protein
VEEAGRTQKVANLLLINTHTHMHINIYAKL